MYTGTLNYVYYKDVCYTSDACWTKLCKQHWKLCPSSQFSDRDVHYTSRVVCCPLVSDDEYAPRALLRLGKRRGTLVIVEKDGTDGRTPPRCTECDSPDIIMPTSYMGCECDGTRVNERKIRRTKPCIHTLGMCCHTQTHKHTLNYGLAFLRC